MHDLEQGPTIDRDNRLLGRLNPRQLLGSSEGPTTIVVNVVVEAGVRSAGFVALVGCRGRLSRLAVGLTLIVPGHQAVILDSNTNQFLPATLSTVDSRTLD